MKIKPLDATPVEEVISCFLKAFEGYFVKLPEETEYWKSRFLNARVDWSLSFGAFEQENLVGFIINGVDQHLNQLTAYNTGTGVLPAYRGKAVVDQIYKYAIPLLKERGVEKCLLEVICENKKAIQVYERIGFKIKRELRSYRGELPQNLYREELQKCHFSKILSSGLYQPEHYSWDNTAEAVLVREDLQTLCLKSEDSLDAFLVLDPAGNILQIENINGDYKELLHAVKDLPSQVQIKNIDKRRKELILTLEGLNFTNTVNQFEMEKFL